MTEFDPGAIDSAELQRVFDEEDVTPDAEEFLANPLLQPPPLPPANGWHPFDFPELTFDLIPYSSSANFKADPNMTVTTAGWLYIEAGNGRIALPDRAEWNKFVYMVECLWNAHQLSQQTTSEGETDGSQVDECDSAGTPPGADHAESGSRGGAASSLSSEAESREPAGRALGEL